LQNKQRKKASNLLRNLCEALGAMESSLVIYKVKWKELAKHMTRQLFYILAFGFIAFMLIYLFSLTFSYVISVFFKCAYVTIDDDVISGRNYWLFKKHFNLNDIENAFPFNSNGMPVVVFDAGKNGEIYIPIHIENSEELFGILDKYVKST
jgi:hypothetical protein